MAEVRTTLQDGYLYPEALAGEFASGLAELESGAQAGSSLDQVRIDLESLLGQLPPGTADFASREERIDLARQTGDSYEGIGAFIAFRSDPPRIVLLSVVDGSPAQQVGLAAHDAIVSIEGEPVGAAEGLEAAARIRGPEGTRVRLEVVSPQGVRRTVEITRRRMAPASDYRARVMSTGSVHLEVPVIADGSLVQAIEAAMLALEEEPDAGGLVLDLRIAGSAGHWPLESMLGLFLRGRQGDFVGAAGGGPLEISATDLHGTQSVPLVLLVGADTSGAPEIFAAAIQASQRGAVVGAATPGGVFGFGEKVLSDGSLLRFAQSTYTTRLGQDLGFSGVQPNITIDTDWDQVTETYDPALGVALELLQRLVDG